MGCVFVTTTVHGALKVQQVYSKMMWNGVAGDGFKPRTVSASHALSLREVLWSAVKIGYLSHKLYCRALSFAYT